MVDISEGSIEFMVLQEDGPELYYDKTEEHWDWPAGQSGPTAGVGYDCGYVSDEECKADWTGIVDTDTLNQLRRGIGKRGPAAHLFVVANRQAITIPYVTAIREFREREVPKWVGRMRLALPNFDLLPPDSAGAITSVGYNRGTGGFTSTLRRFYEMRHIHQAMLDQTFHEIPGLIDAMKRLWPNPNSDLYKRREAEAKLFARGLGMDWPKQVTT